MPNDNDSSRAVAIGDVDADGDLDMVFGNGGQNRLYLNNGSGTFTDATATRMPADNDLTYAVVLGDVDGDGDLDMISGNYATQNRLYRNDHGTFTDVIAMCMPTDNDITLAVALGDVDGDTDLDLVLGNGNYFLRGQQNRLYRNDGGTFTDVTANNMPAAYDWTYDVALGDMDGDGDLDMVLGNYGRQNLLYLNDGTGRFSDATGMRMPTDNDITLAVALGDVDGDTDLDMVYGNVPQSSFSPGTNHLYLNLVRQLDAPSPARIGRRT